MKKIRPDFRNRLNSQQSVVPSSCNSSQPIIVPKPIIEEVQFKKFKKLHNANPALSKDLHSIHSTFEPNTKNKQEVLGPTSLKPKTGGISFSISNPRSNLTAPIHPSFAAESDEMEQEVEESRESSSNTEQPNVEWPPKLKEYVERAFECCRNDTDRKKTELHLRSIITEALTTDRLYDTDWDLSPLPKLATSAGPSPTFGDSPPTVKFQFDKRTFKQKKTNINNNKRKQAVFFEETSLTHVGLDDVQYDEGKKLQRAKRFSVTKEEDVEMTAIIDKRPNSFFFNQNGEPDLEIFDTIKGTSKSLEKQYLRLTEPPDPSTVRPELVLKNTLKMLRRKWKQNPDYHYVCEQLKSVRQDLTVQRIKNKFTVEVYEEHARLALLNGDMSEFNQCQTQLKELYENKDHRKNEIEFTAYRILYYVYANSLSDILRLVAEMTPEKRANPVISHALDVRNSYVMGNYNRFFKLYTTAPNMAHHIMILLAPSLRTSALKAIIQAFVIRFDRFLWSFFFISFRDSRKSFCSFSFFF
eukprot:TRINITY_DN666_c0_g1_i4.p1 TRINITY_DN666_c0_g1~~TRINITY_DN666_c0_g1_i4.p1  ORF type:complete len:552 (+),score=107.94 TRINITY_DN666_c0_g1_i4:77-1657(+)